VAAVVCRVVSDICGVNTCASFDSDSASASHTHTRLSDDPLPLLCSHSHTFSLLATRGGGRGGLPRPVSRVWVVGPSGALSPFGCVCVISALIIYNALARA